MKVDQNNLKKELNESLLKTRLVLEQNIILTRDCLNLVKKIEVEMFGKPKNNILQMIINIFKFRK